MEKKELLQYYQKLRSIYNEYEEVNQLSKNGKLKKERDKANSRLKHILQGFEIYVERNPQLLDFITSSGVNAYSKNDIWNEFLTHHYFKSELELLLLELKKVIDKKNDI